MAARLPHTSHNLADWATELSQRLTDEHRRLAGARPDVFLPDLARSLNNLSNRLGELGRREDGLAAIEEAVAIRQRLATRRPDVY
ncbi:MAG: tetratricopeptide repeat protein [Micromonosporaceae bacterium]